MAANPSAQAASNHRWRFFRAGGFDQVWLDQGADLAHLDELDQKLWLALSCPTRGIEFDGKTLDLIDTDNDGRIRPPEVLAAVRWACAMLKDPGELLKGGEAVPLGAINDGNEQGKKLLASARRILLNLGRKEAESISLVDTTDTVHIFAQTRFNGDGIVPSDAADDAATGQAIQEMIDCVGGEADRSGKAGISGAKADQFFAEAQAYSDWWAKAENDRAAVLPLGDATQAAAAALKAVRAKVDDYLGRCRLAAFDAQALAVLNPQTPEFAAMAQKDLSLTAAEASGMPLARVEAGRALPLEQGLNPAWAAAVADLRRLTVEPLLGGRSALSEADWNQLTAKLAPYEAWAATKAGAAVEKLGLGRVREMLGGDLRQRVAALVAEDLALEGEFSAIAQVDKLVRFHRDLYKLLNNFINFRDFYGRADKAVFQAGRLYLDQRACDLCVRVEDMAKHGTMAHLSCAYLAYCECTRKGSAEKLTIAAAMTAGDSDNLMLGRNGVFYDRAGLDWDATIVKIVENPIAIRQAFWAPYKRAIRWVEDLMAKRAAAADAQSTTALASAAQAMAAPPAAAAPAPGKFKIDIGVVAALGVAVGGITAALGVLLQAFFGLGIWMPVGVVALVMLISGPSMVIAWLKLRQRNLGPILDANGWAVNSRARINVPFGRSLTSKAMLPAGSHVSLGDPYADSKKGRNWTIAMIILAAALGLSWYCGWVEQAVPGVLPKPGWLQRQEKARTPPATAPAATQAK